jgi:hypothetical protein
MAIDPSPEDLVLWKFLTTSGRAGGTCWHWQVMTQTGQLVTNSRRQFDTFTECEADAKANRYVPREKRNAH